MELWDSVGGRMRTFIPGNVPSSKNSKIMTKRGIFHSKTVSKYLQKLGVKKYSAKGYENYKKRPNLFEEAIAPMKNELNHFRKDPPYQIGFFFIRGTRHKFDFINACQIICDLLVAHGVLEDDNMDYLIPYPLSSRKLTEIGKGWYGYNKENPGVWLDF